MSHLEEAREVDKDGYVTCGVFLPLPFDLAKDFPNKDHEDDSVPHITLLFAGKLSPSDYRKFSKIVGRVARRVRPFTMDLAQFGEFVNASGQRIPHMSPSFVCRHKLSILHGVLRRAVETAGIKCAHTYGSDSVPSGVPYEVMFNAHATLDYLHPTACPYSGPKPTGSWRVLELECWGHEKYRFQLGRTKYDQPVGLQRSALSNHYKYPSAVHEEDHVDLIPGGLADKSKPSDFDPKQLAMGIRVELEHTKNLKIAREIAMDHLKEDPRYYTKLKKIEPQHEAETSLKGYTRHTDPGAAGSMNSAGGGLGLASDPRYQDWLDKVMKRKTRKPFRSQ